MLTMKQRFEKEYQRTYAVETERCELEAQVKAMISELYKYRDVEISTDIKNFKIVVQLEKEAGKVYRTWFLQWQLRSGSKDWATAFRYVESEQRAFVENILITKSFLREWNGPTNEYPADMMGLPTGVNK